MSREVHVRFCEGLGLKCPSLLTHDCAMPLPGSRRLSDAYRFPGFRPLQTVVGIFGAPGARVVTLVRRSKKRRAGHAGALTEASTIARYAGSAISRVAACGSSWSSSCAGSIADAVGR